MANSYARTLVETTAAMSLIPKPAGVSAKHKYTIDLEARDLHHVVGGFCWVTNTEQNPGGSVIYVAEMRFVP